MAFYKKPWTDPLTREDIKFSLTDSLNGIDSNASLAHLLKLEM